MTPYEFTDIYVALATKLDAQWAIFFSIHLAIFGGIIYIDRPLKWSERMFAILAYLVFAIINFYTLRSGQQAMAAVVADIAAIDPSAVPKTTGAFFRDLFGSPFALYQGTVSLLIHIGAAVLVMAAVALDRPKKPTRT